MPLFMDVEFDIEYYLIFNIISQLNKKYSLSLYLIEFFIPLLKLFFIYFWFYPEGFI